MPDQGGPAEGARSVGAELAQWRHDAGMTGAELAKQIKVSQAKISKIENGGIRPKAADIIAIGAALGVSAPVVDGLLRRATAEPRRFGRWRPAGAAPGLGQEDVAALERGTAELRGVHVGVPPGLLHTDGYAAAVMTAYTRPLDVSGLGPIPAAVTLRKHRQEILSDPGKTFLFVVAETALLNRVATPAVMLEQIERIRSTARQANVEVRILRSDHQLPYPPLHDYSLFDGRVVVIDTMTTTVVNRESSDVMVYRRVFELYWEQATDVIEPILDGYARLYAAAAMPAGGASIAADLVTPPEEGRD